MASHVISEMFASKPAPSVAAYAQSYAGFAEQVGAEVRRVEPARAHSSIVIAFSGRLTVGPIEDAGDELPAFVASAGSGPLISSHEGRLQCVEIGFAPWASTVLLGAPLTANDGPVGLVDLLGHDAATLAERLTTASDWTERFALLDDLFSARIARANRLPRREVRWAWEQLERSGGAIPIGALSREIGWSGRHFANCFRDATGLSPKAAARRLRFDRARCMIEGSMTTLADVAAACGYSDQSHLTRDFGELAGCAPAAFRAARFAGLPGTPASVLKG